MISISKRELFIKSFELFKKNAQFVINIGILLFVIQHMIPIIIGMLFPAYSIPYFIFHITYLVVTTTISLWAIMQILQILREQATDSFKSLFIYFPKVFQAIAGSFIITFSLVILGMIVLLTTSSIDMSAENITIKMLLQSITNSTIGIIVVLGYCIGATYLWIKAYFFIYYIVDQNLGAIQAIKKSLDMTTGYEGDLFVLWISTICMNFLGILLYGIGLLFTLPYTLILLSMFYTKYLCAIKES